MALPFGPVLLLAVVGAAVFGGLDVRKKKKSGATNGGAPPADDAAMQVVACANVIDFNADGSQAAINGSAWQSADAVDLEGWALHQQRPQILFTLCEPDPMVVQLLEQFCAQNPDFDFYGVYVPRLPEPLRSQSQGQCVAQNVLVGFDIYTPIGDKEGRAYYGNFIPELRLSPGGNIANTLASILTFAQGVDHPQAQDYSEG